LVVHQSKENDRVSVRTLLDYANDSASIHAPMNGVVSVVIFSLLGLALSWAVLAADADGLAALGLY
jgi:hypothetical protein